MVNPRVTSIFIIRCSLFDILKAIKNRRVVGGERSCRVIHVIRGVRDKKAPGSGLHKLGVHATMAALVLFLNFFLFSLDPWFLFVRPETGVSNCSNASK